MISQHQSDVSPLTVSDQHKAFWSNSKTVSDIIVPIPDKCIDELDAVARDVNIDSFLKISADRLRACTGFAAEMREILFNGTGITVIDRLPVERYTVEQSRLIAGVMANLISPLMSQDVNGTYLYDVIDAKSRNIEDANGKAFKRRSKTNVSQPFHTDGPWFELPPHLVGLFCISPAATGGLSQVSSLYSAVQQVIKTGLDASVCEQLVAWNKMGEHKETENPFRLLPIIEKSASGTIMRHYADYVRTGFKLSESDTPVPVEEFLALLDQTLTEQACEPFKLEAGQYQYVNNWTVAHARAGFSDDLEGNSGRHLVRLWNRSPTTASGAKAEVQNSRLEAELVH